MNNKILKVYLLIFSVICFFTSLLGVYELIDKLNLPKGIITALVNYGYLLIHIISFIAMLNYGNNLLVKRNN